MSTVHQFLCYRRSVEIFGHFFICCQCLCIYKYGDKKLKWYVIIPHIVVVWIVVTLTVGVPPYLEEYGAQNTIGFCTANVFSAPYIGMAVSLTVGAMLFLSIELTFCILLFT